jgi:phosphate transport system permease protein
MQVRQEGSVVDVALRSDVIEGYDVAARAKALSRLRSIDIVFRVLTRAAALGVLILLGGVIISLIDGSLPALRAFCLNFLI